LQGDVTAVIDGNGNTVAEYAYDAWGKVLTATGTFAEVNPIRYRGYYYDTETNLYYCQSRYYNPEVGRWLNFDEVIILYRTVDTLSGTNGFAYCDNDAVNGTDPEGYFTKDMHKGETEKWAKKFFAGSENSKLRKDGDTLARKLSTADEWVDYAKSPINAFSEKWQSWHFNTNAHKGRGLEDTRIIQFDEQCALAKKHIQRTWEHEAVKDIGRGLHAIQDTITHTQNENKDTAIRGVITSGRTTQIPGTNTNLWFEFYAHPTDIGADDFHYPYDEENFKYPHSNCLYCDRHYAAAIITCLTLLYYEIIYDEEF
jgi:RHS repeat-associated protein